MKIEVIDYTELFYKDIIEQDVPSERSGKLVVIENPTERFIVLSPRALSFYHANICERFVEQKGLTGHYRGDRFYIDSKDWIILGGCRWHFKNEELLLFGVSFAYGSIDLEQITNDLKKSGKYANVTCELY